jgi:hypothetical protein
MKPVMIFIAYSLSGGVKGIIRDPDVSSQWRALDLLKVEPVEC